MELTVRVPRGGGARTLYAEGVLIDMVVTRSEAFITLDDDYAVCLYYRLGTFRRLYVCAKESLFPGCRHWFPEAEASLCTVAVLEGRGFDRFKRSMRLLSGATCGRFHRYPPSFFWQLSELCRRGRNSRHNLALLVQGYDRCVLMGGTEWK